MRIVIINDGKYGDRAIEKISKEFPETELITLPEYDANEMLDDFELDDQVIEKIKAADLVIKYHRHPDVTYEICSPDKPVIQAIYNGEGFLNQIKRELEAEIIMPSSMCHLTPDQDNEVFNRFAEKFGMPVYEIEMRENSNIIDKITAIRRSPCGSTEACIPMIEGKEVTEESLNEFALAVRHECREPMSYVINRVGVAETAMSNHFFPLINALRKLRPDLFTKGGSLDQLISRLKKALNVLNK